MTAKTSAARILVVDDEDVLREMLGDALRLSGFEVLEAADGSKALTVLQGGKVDLIISDVNMPGMDGYEMLSHLRAQGDETPAIMLTARRERADVTKGLKLGADDYVTKPFGLEELILRVNAVLRRTMGAASVSSKLVCGPVEIIDDLHQVLVDGAEVELSPTEYHLLTVLIENKGKVISRSKLLLEVWDINFDTGTNVVDTYISYLRRKVHTETYQGIKTVRGIGFQMIEGK
jgi:two-component system OmpR family response regulator